MRMTYTITADEVGKAYGEHTVLSGVTLRVRPGTVFSLLGPNGAGKTTLVRILTTLTRADTGTLTVAGCDVAADPSGVRRRIALTGQNAAVDGVLTARENLVMFARLRRHCRADARRRAGELLERFDLTGHGDRRVATFSGGLRRRLDLALSLIDRPAVLFLDEPSTGLDPRSREHVWDAVRDLTGQGTTVFLTTQYLEEADQLADTIALLHDGRIAAIGTADELKDRLEGETAELTFRDAEQARRGLDALIRRAPEGAPRLARPGPGTALEVDTDGTAAQVHALLAALDDAGAPAERIALRRPSLDDVFLALTGDRQAPPAPQQEAPLAWSAAGLAGTGAAR